MTTAPLSRNRAFLSHATSDKEFVHQVENRLGKQRVVVDEREFITGTEFVTAIRRAISESQIVALFASKASLQSLWVKFEIAEAEELLRSEAIRTALAFIIDNETSHSDLPRWMQKALISRVSRPNSAARTIELHLNRLLATRRKPLFLGRSELIQEATDLLIPPAGQLPPRLLIVSGLPDTGRRTFVRNVFADVLSIETYVTFALRSTDSMDSLHLQLLEELGSLDTKTQFTAARESFQIADMATRGKLLAELIASCCTDNSAVIVIDDGALLDPTGKYTDEALALMQSLAAYPNVYVGIVHLRRPNASRQDLSGMRAAYCRVPPISADATKQLLSQQLRQVSIPFTEDDIDELSFYVKGFPPSVSIAVSLIRERGLGLVKADKAMLVGLQTQTFTTLLNGLSLGEAEWQLLSFLAAGLDLPFEGLVALLNKDVKDVAEALTKLIDLNLVQPSDEGYAISAPIRFAVQAIRGFLSDADYSTITKRLKERFWESGEGLPSLQVVDSTIAAALRSDSEGKDFRQFVIPSALFRAAKNLHDLRGFDSLVKSRRLLQRLLEIEPRDRKALSLLCKIQARLGEFEKARTVLETIHAAGYIEEFFLTGFILWKKRDYIDAVAAFRTTIAKGNRGAEVFHGLGSCLLRMKLLDDADREIDNGSRGRKPNRMLIDLAAQIAIERGDYAKADGLIEQLLILRAEADYHHRKATLLNKQGKYREALSHARIAAGDFTRRFEAETVLIDTLIELGEVDEADQKLEDLEKRERHQRDRRDIVLGLRSKMWLKKGNWRQAESMCRAMENKDSDYYTGLLVEALNQKIADLGLSPGIRAEARAELQSYLGTGLSAAPSFALAGDAVSVEFEEEGDDQLVS